MTMKNKVYGNSEFNPTIQLVFEKLIRPHADIKTIKKKICGKKIGSGCYRSVYILKQDPKYVVKIERDMSIGTFSNATEWRNYINFKDSFLGKWLCPCEGINETGQVLIQQRCELRKRKFYPKYIPKAISDIKLQNFGWIGDNFYCFDYPFLGAFWDDKVWNKMKYAKWWNVNATPRKYK